MYKRDWDCFDATNRLVRCIVIPASSHKANAIGPPKLIRCRQFQFGFQIGMTIKILFRFQRRIQVDDWDFNIILIIFFIFLLNSSIFNHFLLKDRKWLSLCWLFNQIWLKIYIEFDRKLSKTTRFLIDFDIFNWIGPFSNELNLFLIKFNIFSIEFNIFPIKFELRI